MTLVAVQCWSGDQARVEQHIGMWLHHGLRVLLISPTNEPLTYNHDQVICDQRGLNDYNGEVSVERYKAQLDALLDYDEDWYLLLESDSFCLSPRLPDVLFDSPDAVWANTVDLRYFVDMNDDPDPEVTYQMFNPAMQSPWFFSRSALERMLEVADTAWDACPPYARFIDWWFPTATRMADLDLRSFGMLGVSHPFQGPPGISLVAEYVRMGAVMIHSVKYTDIFLSARDAYEELVSL